MYINPKTIKELETLCFIKHREPNHAYNYHHHLHQQHYMDFMFLNNRTRIEDKKYDLFKITKETHLQECLGIKFLIMDPSIFEYHKENSFHDEAFYDDGYARPTMMNHFRKCMGLKLDHNDFESEIMKIEDSIQIISNKMAQISFVRDTLDYTSLITEWKSFAQHHNINLDSIFKEILDSVENDNLDNQEWLDIKNELRVLQEQTFDVVGDAHNFIRHFYKSESLNHRLDENKLYNPRQMTEDFEKININFNQKINESRLLPELETIKNKIEEFNVSTNTRLKEFNNEIRYLTPEVISKNNMLLLTAIENAYIIMKDKINEQLKDCGYRNMAIDFSNKVNQKDYSEQRISSYLEKNKDNVMLVVDNFTFESVKYKKMAIFTDYSCAVLIEGQEKIEWFMNMQSINKLVKTAMIVYLKNVLRKNPTIAKVMSAQFNQRVEKENKENLYHYYCTRLHYDKLLLCITTYFKNENILKSEKFNFIEAIEKSTAYEKLDDKMNKTIREHNIRKYAESIVSNKYKHLYNAQSYKLFKELYDLKIDTKVIQEMLGKKLAAVESETMFNDNIKTLINSFNDFNMEAIKLKAESVKAKTISDTDNILILEISNYTQSKKLGSGSWCITRNKTYFDQYTEQGSKQYFIYDFNQSSKNTKSLIGVTLLKTLKVKAAHTKSDARLNDNKIVEYLTSKVKEFEEAKKPNTKVPVSGIKKPKKVSNNSTTNVNDVNQNGMIIGF